MPWASGQSILLGDLTGDGTLDVVGGAALADVGASNTGKVLLWAGSPTLSGASVAPDAIFSVTGATANDRLGLGVSPVLPGDGIVLGDVTGDGVIDAVILAPEANAYDTDDGAIYIWTGGATPSGPAALTVPTAKFQDRLGAVN
jgi:hypothetical protein